MIQDIQNTFNTLLLSSQTRADMANYIDLLFSAMPKKNIDEKVSEYAERKRYLDPGITNFPGKVKFDKNPYMREIVDCFSDQSSVCEIALMKPTQIGATTLTLENIIGYNIQYGIGPMLFISGDAKMAEDSMELRIDQCLESCGLQSKIKPTVVKKNQRNTGDTKTVKSYGGTFLRGAGPKEESKIRTFPARVALLDEIDIYPDSLRGGGSVIEKILRRMDAQGASKKILYLSTPKLERTSKIEPLFEAGDKRYYNVPCPECGQLQNLVWSQFKYKDENGKFDYEMIEIDGAYKITKDPTYYECIKCKAHWKEHQKSEFLQEEGYGGKAKWIPTKKPDRPRMRSYHLNALYSPIGFLSWLSIAIMWNRVKDDPLALQDFVNDILGETFKEQQDVPDVHDLMRYAEDWEAGFINNKVIMLTLAADIQLDRIEAGLVGWGRDKEAWFIDYWTFEGDTREIESACWNKLAEKIQHDYVREDDVKLNIQIAFVDSQYNKEQVNSFCSNNFGYVKNSISGVYPLISQDRIIGQSTKIIKSDISVPYVKISDQTFKFALYSILNKKPHMDGVFPFGYMHFPKTFNEDFYKQLTAEEIFKERRGKKEFLVIQNPKKRRNEVFDIAKYNIASLQFAINRYFEIENQRRKKNHKQEIEIDHHLFFDIIEDSLYNE